MYFGHFMGILIILFTGTALKGSSCALRGIFLQVRE